MRTRVASTRLIGRAAELAELETAVAEAADGLASLAFVAGESGIGKTRLLAELTRRAREGGALVLTRRGSSRGCCHCSSRWGGSARSCWSSRTCTGPIARRGRPSPSWLAT